MGTCMSSSTRHCVRRPSSSIPLAPSRAGARSSATRSPRTLPRRCARRSSVSRESVSAFAPGRVNLIGEHTDYNEGLALPFAIGLGVTVCATTWPPGSPGEQTVSAYARDLDERDEFPLSEPAPAPGWRAFARGTVAELARAGFPLVGARLQITGD